VSALPAMLRVMVSRWFVDHCGHSGHPSVQTPVLNGLGDIYRRNPFDEVTPEDSNFPQVYRCDVSFA
jgi:hypothetical protein